jgi:hypothetical protein
MGNLAASLLAGGRAGRHVCCANLRFGALARNRPFTAARKSVYAVKVRFLAGPGLLSGMAQRIAAAIHSALAHGDHARTDVDSFLAAVSYINQCKSQCSM